MSPPQGDTSGKPPKGEPIPQPPQHLFGLLGNLPDINPSFPLESVWKLSDIYGPIVKLNLRKEIIVLSNQKFINEVCDEERFEKFPTPALQEVRALLGDGLFTAYITEKNWWKAHRLLIPAFGPLGIQKMFPDMLDIGSQMVMKWDRQGPDHDIDCSDDLTRLAFDTIGLCAFSYRFNEFYSDHAHPFAQQMAEVLVESGRRSNRTAIENQLHYASEQHRQENVQKMHQLCDELVAKRKQHPQPDAKDLLNTMLTAVDRETGEKLSDENIRFNMVTFLVAGHETTSGTLSFCYYNLLKNPEKLHKAQREVDEVVGDGPLKFHHLAKLAYVDACIKETLRVNGPIGSFAARAKQDTLLQGKYFVTKDTFLQLNLRGLHHDHETWGEDVESFIPERMLNGRLQKLPPNSFKPFGNGMRACIGRLFAEQEMLINVALVLQRFQIELADPTYELSLKATLTIKPMDFKMKVRRRPGVVSVHGVPTGIPQNISPQKQEYIDRHKSSSKLKTLTVFFGGNTGTCEGFAKELEGSASEYGFEANVQSLDSATEHLPTDHPVVIIASSYEGKPADNSKKFVSWLEQCDKPDHLKDVKYAVFGVGNSDWANTFHRIPKLVDEKLAKLGAHRCLKAGYTNVKTDLLGPWEDWVDGLWEQLRKGLGVISAVETTDVSISLKRNEINQTLGGKEMNLGTVVANKQLVGTEVGPAKMHLDVRLPEGTVYTAGDYLVVLPRNPKDVVRRILTRFGLVDNDLITITGSKKKFLLADTASVWDFFSSVVELNTPITKRQIDRILQHAKDDKKPSLEKLKGDATYQIYLQKRYSIIDVLDEFDVQIPMNAYVDMLQPLTPRQYSISSSPLYPINTLSADEAKQLVSITYDVFESPAWSGHGTFQGTASTYLASRHPGDRMSCFIRPTNVGFRLPPSPETPVIMIAAGTGLAPMRAFIQERAAIAEAGVRKLGPATLFFGCRHEDKDFIYKEELLEWEKNGIVQVKPAFSKMENKPKYVQDVIWENKDEVADMFKAGGKIYLCGSAARLGKSAAEVCKKIYRERTGAGEKEADEWLERQKEDRYVSDVFG